MSGTPLPRVLTTFPDFARAITKSDVADLTDNNGIAQPQTVRVGTGGAVAYVPFRNTDLQIITETFADGAIIPCTVRRVMSTGTTATNLVGYF